MGWKSASRLGLCAAVLVLSVKRASRAQDASGAMEGATPLNIDPVDDSRYLGKRYKKEAEGFAITPPAGAHIIERHGIDLVSFVVDEKGWGGSLELISPPSGAMTLQEFTDLTVSSLKTGKSFKAVQVRGQTATRQGDKQAIRLTMSMQAELGPNISTVKELKAVQNMDKAQQQVSLLCQELIIQSRKDQSNKSTQFLVLTLYTPWKDMDAATHTFDAMLRNFELYDPEASTAKLVAATKLGKAWLAQRSAEEFAAKIANESQIYRVIVGNKDVGYMQFDEFARERDAKGNLVTINRVGRDGVGFSVNSRSFNDDGSIIYVQNEAFWSFSKDTDGRPLGHFSTGNAISKIKTRVPIPPSQIKPGMPAFQTILPWLQQTATISQDAPTASRPNQPYTITVTFGGDPTQHLPPGLIKQIPVDAQAPLPAVLEYSWTRFVDLTRPSQMTFLTYNSAAQKLDLRNLVITGKRENVNVDGKVLSCYKCVDEIDPNSTTLWVDADGQIRMMATSDQTIMVPTTAEAMKTRWQSRLGDQ